MIRAMCAAGAYQYRQFGYKFVAAEAEKEADADACNAQVRNPTLNQNARPQAHAPEHGGEQLGNINFYNCSLMCSLS